MYRSERESRGRVLAWVDRAECCGQDRKLERQNGIWSLWVADGIDWDCIGEGEDYSDLIPCLEVALGEEE